MDLLQIGQAPLLVYIGVLLEFLWFIFEIYSELLWFSRVDCEATEEQEFCEEEEENQAFEQGKLHP